MVEIKIDCNSAEEMTETRDKIHKGLVGSPAYINSEIVLTENNETSCSLLVGNSNEDDVVVGVKNETLTWEDLRNGKQ